MSVIRSISLDKSNLYFPSNWEEGSDLNRQSFTVTIDEKNTGGGFRYTVSDVDWFDAFVSENTFTVIVKENFNTFSRTGYITIHHNAIEGSEGEKTVVINQDGINCDIRVIGENSIDLWPLFGDNTTTNKIEKELTISVTGGNKKYFIKAIKEYRQEKRTDNTTVEKAITFDNGIKVEKMEKLENDSLINKLKITSYGRVFFDESQYYVITLAHDNDVTKTCDVSVRYYKIPGVAQRTSTRNTPSLRRGSKSNVTKTEVNRFNIPTFEEKFMTESTFEEPSLNIVGLNTPTRRKGGKSDTNDAIIFEAVGGNIGYDISIKPKGAAITVSISSNFVTYSVINSRLILTAKPNPYNIERSCVIKIRNSQDPFSSITKLITQKAFESEEDNDSEKEEEVLKK